MNGKLKNAEAFKAGSRPAPAVRGSDILELEETVSGLGDGDQNDRWKPAAYDKRTQNPVVSASGEGSTPVVTLIPKGRTTSTAPATFAGVNPPVRITPFFQMGMGFDQTCGSPGKYPEASGSKCALGGGGKPQRRLAEIGRRHLINELHDAVLPSLSDLQEIGVVFTKMRPELCLK
jgi:hypothetical protein